MADNRTRRQKLEAIAAPGSGATDGERANAEAMLSRMRTMPAVPMYLRVKHSAQLQDDVDDFLRTYRPGFSNGDRRPRRPIVDVPTDDHARVSKGATVGSLQFGDVLGPGDIRQEAIDDAPYLRALTDPLKRQI